MNDDILYEIISHLDIVNLLKIRTVSSCFNNRVIEILRAKLSLLSGLNLNDYSLEELIHLSKIYIIKSKIFAGENSSYIIIDSVISPTTISQVYTMGVRPSFGNINIKPHLILELNDIIQIIAKKNYHVMLNNEGNVFIYYRSIPFGSSYEYHQVTLDNIIQIAFEEDRLMLLRSNKDLYYCKVRIDFVNWKNILNVSEFELIKNNIKQITGKNNLFLSIDDNDVYFWLFDEGILTKFICPNDK